jgi:hypothetical protein
LLICRSQAANKNKPALLTLKIPAMTKPANSPDKPSPADTPTQRPHDNGGKTKLHSSDKQYNADEPHGGDIATRHENEEQPVNSVNQAPEE